MALILGDIHGNVDKAKKFLAFRPEETHVFAGDYVDSFEESDEDIYETLKLCIESQAVLLLGNHDLHYFKEPPFLCSGRRYHMADSLEKIFEEFITRFVPCLSVDGFIVTHGGISEGFGNSALKTTDVNEVANKITILWYTYLETRFNRGKSAPRLHNPLFGISPTRGGMDKFSGPFWADYRSDRFYGVPQIFGHSKTPLGAVMNLKNTALTNVTSELNTGGKHDFWAIGCDNNRRICFDSTAKKAVTFE